ncbi:hypothetical protein FQN54_002757 [Arachnomyces sp. PD_36]|nr:hypothetical protein FQN54_002757 [Arachnomyces sp. PD_36]
MRFNTLGNALLFLTQLAPVFAASHEERVAAVFSRNIASKSVLEERNTGEDDSSIYPTKFTGVTWDNEGWRLKTTVLDQGHYQSRGSIANGYIGINVAAAGPFFELDVPAAGDVINGWPLYSRRQTFATIGGFYDSQPTTNGSNFEWMNQYGGESVISGVPHWSGLVLDLGDDKYLDATVDNATISDFSSTLDMKAGVLSWSYTWKPEGSGSFDIEYRLFAHKLHVNQAVVRMEITPSEDTQATVVNVIDGFSAVRTDFVDSGSDGDAIYSSVRPNGIDDVTAHLYAAMVGDLDESSLRIATDKPYVHSNESSIAQAADVKLTAKKTTAITKFVGIASSDAFKDPKEVAKCAYTEAVNNGYEASLKSHIEEWATAFPDNSVDRFSDPKTGSLSNGPHIVETALTAVSNPFHILQNTISANAKKEVGDAPVDENSVAVGGLTSDSYGGLIFWDADIWMQPGIVAAFPEAAKGFTNFRVAKYKQALLNAQTSYQGSQNDTTFSEDAAIFPWTCGRFGNCTGTGPCFDYQYHLNGDIGLQFINYWVTTGDTEFFKEKLFPVYDSVATLFSEVLDKNGTQYSVANLTDPDEYADHVDSGGFTMAVISETLLYANSFRKLFGLEENVTWTEMAENVLIPKDPATGITMEYTTMNGSTQVKQADIVLNTFPLRYTDSYSPEDSLRDLDYYAGKQSPNGPGMTYAIYSVVANEVSPSGCSAYTYAQYSYDPYMRAPFFQFSEQMVDEFILNGGTHPAYPFLTGNGGANQVVLFGYLGFRQLPDLVLHVDPNLPPQIPYVQYRTFYWRGWPITAASNYTHTTISRATDIPAFENADPLFRRSTIPVHVGPESNTKVFTLPSDGSVLTIPNRQVSNTKTYAGNTAECRPVTSKNDYAPGQFPIGAIDGAVSTRWQPALASEQASITVELDPTSGKKITGFLFDWAHSPPVNASVAFHDNPEESDPESVKSGDWKMVTMLTNIELSHPYDPETTDLNKIAIYQGNITNVTLSEPAKRPRFATLFVSGNQALGEAEIIAGNGTGATIAEWAVLEE